MQRFLVYIVFALISNTLFAQQAIVGRVVDAYSNEPISHVYVENVSTGLLYETQEDGTYKMIVSIGDTLLFSSIGYHWKKEIVEHFKNQTHDLEQQVYDLQQVVKRAPVSYEGFKYQILSMKPFQDTLQLHIPFEKYYALKEYTPGTLSYSLDGGITQLYNTYNKHARNALRAIELLDKKHYIFIANNILNKEFVLDIIAIKEVYFDDFMAFCSFTDEFLATHTEYQIITMLYLQYELFLQKHPNIERL